MAKSWRKNDVENKRHDRRYKLDEAMLAQLSDRLWQIGNLGHIRENVSTELFLLHMGINMIDIWKSKGWDSILGEQVEEQLDLYLFDLVGQSNSLTYGLYEDGKLIGVSMGHIRHWYSGTEYYIDELCIQTNKQGNGIGTLFLKEIEKGIKEIGLVQIFLQTEKSVPAYGFYQKNGFYELKDQVSFVKKV